MKIEVGYWETRDGRKARVLCTDAEFIYPCVGYVEIRNGDVRLVTWTLNGRLHGTTSDYNDDLIRPWIDRPVIDWSKERDWVKAITMDAGGQWFRSSKVPNQGVNCWHDGGWCQRMHPSEHPQFTGDWKDSLCVRPKDEL